MKQLHVFLSDAEQTHLDTQLDATGMTASAFIRSLIMGADLKPRPPEVYAELLRLIAAIGNNINQIARVANGTGRVRQTEIDALLELLSEVWRLVKSL